MDWERGRRNHGNNTCHVAYISFAIGNPLIIIHKQITSDITMDKHFALIVHFKHGCNFHWGWRRYVRPPHHILKVHFCPRQVYWNVIQNKEIVCFRTIRLPSSSRLFGVKNMSHSLLKTKLRPWFQVISSHKKIRLLTWYSIYLMYRQPFYPGYLDWFSWSWCSTAVFVHAEGLLISETLPGTTPVGQPHARPTP
jgi:hypothetical protein